MDMIKILNEKQLLMGWSQVQKSISMATSTSDHWKEFQTDGFIMNLISWDLMFQFTILKLYYSEANKQAIHIEAELSRQDDFIVS